mmetsp:Transcript_20497/g.36978  ORF Transcript_20497/g.36978 Transcript_20497/m.36978 type:complete len:230 (+) Transcript_20497:130-819(+)|eukprot:CAMPEP_0205914096 /NCGR_PEP_ID=MMETSP1325-20131115/7004_1 /ASSEMBLY_ACC=CAM_ASM_000708 /TAXON_ID=236786 /ORGANISM="Florenciella sp., Strain RCC1007" /LENGTH=229 /DNA_ID=CAMNT_0053281103 /DNA_START=37 /DNA_END=726 /DNA_ORIENTATION=+
MEEEKAQRAKEGLPQKMYDQDGNEMKEEEAGPALAKSRRDMMTREEQVAESKAYWEGLMEAQQQERAFTAAKRPRHELKMNEYGMIDVIRPSAVDKINFAKSRIEYIRYKYKIVDEDEEAIRKLEQERIERWKARPPSSTVDEEDEHDNRPTGSAGRPGHRKGRTSSSSTNAREVASHRSSQQEHSASSSAESSRRNSREDLSGDARLDSVTERHGDLMIENLEDEPVG